MLTTQRGHELPLFPVVPYAGTTTWRMVTLHLGMPYVFLTYAIRDGGEWVSQTSIFWRHEDVLDLCKEIKNDKSRKLLSVFLLRPAGPGMDSSWAWSSVKEVFAGKYPDCDLDFPLYVTVEGEEYGDTGYLGPHETYESLEQIFPAAEQSKPKPTRD